MRPTAEAYSSIDRTTVELHSKFAEQIKTVLQEPKLGNIVETGTFKGNGTTKILLAARQDGAILYSIEVNPSNHAAATKNLEMYFDLKLLLGYTLPLELMPSVESVRKYMARHESSSVYCDYDVVASNKLINGYMKETGHDVPNDMLGKALKKCGLRPGLVLLDSAGHLGFLEFLYTIYTLCGSCYIALDDTNHVKHCDSLAYARKRPDRFKIVAEMDEKTGWAIVKYSHKDNELSKMSEADFYRYAMSLYENGEGVC